MTCDKPCNFCPTIAEVWIRLDKGRGEALYLCHDHNNELTSVLVNLQDLRCAECGAEIYLDEPTEED